MFMTNTFFRRIDIGNSEMIIIKTEHIHNKQIHYK